MEEINAMKEEMRAMAERIQKLEANQIGVLMPLETRRNLFNALQTALVDNINLGIGTSSPSFSAILDLSSVQKGVLFPRMTKAQRDAIVSPATGLVIYQTDNTPALYYYSGSAWAAV